MTICTEIETLVCINNSQIQDSFRISEEGIQSLLREKAKESLRKYARIRRSKKSNINLINQMINNAYKNYKSNEIKATFVHEYCTDSSYNKMLDLFNEAILIIKTQGNEVFRSLRFKYIAKKFEVRWCSKELTEYVHAFKIQAYKSFIKLLRSEYGIEDEEVKNLEFDCSKTEAAKEDIQNQRNYIAYIGEGNNSNLIRNVIKTKTWWNIWKSINLKKWDFIWTQWIQSKITSSMSSFDNSNMNYSSNKFVYNKLSGNHNISNK